MIDYFTYNPPDNQSKLYIENNEGFMLWLEVKKWIEDNPNAWDRYITIAEDESKFGEISPNYVIQILRHRYKVSVRNGYAPVLARIAMEQSPDVRFRLAKSKVDGFCEVKL